MSIDREEIFLRQYEEVCKSYHAIAEFRGKLLALLPIVSGTGISLLLYKTNEPLDTTHLFAVGVFGALVTVGLFFYELRGIQRCKSLIRIGRKLEEELLHQFGQFTDRPPRGLNFIGSETAAWIIYPTMLLAWLYVAVVGIFKLAEDSHQI
jgi:hypothetical protein